MFKLTAERETSMHMVKSRLVLDRYLGLDLTAGRSPSCVGVRRTRFTGGCSAAGRSFWTGPKVQSLAVKKSLYDCKKLSKRYLKSIIMISFLTEVTAVTVALPDHNLPARRYAMADPILPQCDFRPLKATAAAGDAA